MIEAQTYRHYGHSRTDPATYRPAEEVEEWMRRDPIDIARQRLADRGTSTDDVVGADQRADRVVEEAIAEATAAPDADPADALADVWADGGAAWRT